MPRSRVFQKARILAAEDNLINQKVISRMVEKLGCQISVVDNGKEAIQALEESHYDLVLMDCHMPEMDGYIATQKIRMSKNEAIKNIPIVAVTANSRKGERERCLEAGMNEYMCKPITEAQLYKVLRRFLLSNTGHVTLSTILELENIQIEGERDIVVELIETFLAATPEQIATVEKAIANLNFRAASEAAHAIKSSALTLGALPLGEICQQIEDLHSNVTGDGTAPHLAQQLREEFLQVERELRAMSSSRNS
jgi:CheY-like chemotaxis protein